MDHTILVGTLDLVLDLFGTFMFALSGAAAGVRHRLDLFGVLVLAFCAGTSGGILRDLLIGAVPPTAITDWRYLTAAVLAGLGTFWYPGIARIRSAVPLLDSVGLAVFAVDGAKKALDFGLGPVAATVLGMLSAIGGGLVRDILVSEVPVLFRSEIYAVAALAGASVVVLGRALSLPAGPTAVAGVLLCLGLRLTAIRRGWSLPIAGEKTDRRA